MRIRPLATIAALVVLAGTARANPLDNFGAGSRSVAMGGAVVATVEDFGSPYYNPAGLAQNRDIQFSVGYFFAEPTLEINGLDVNEDQTRGLWAGFVTPPIELPWGVEMHGGGLFHLPDKRVARTLSLPFDQPTYLLFGPSNQRATIMFPFTFAIRDWLSIAAGISLFVESSGGPNFVLREEREGNELLFSEGTINATQKGAFFPMAGLQVQATEHVRLGFDYRAKNEVLYEVPLTVLLEPLFIFDVDDPILPESSIDLNQEVFSFFAPEQFTFGAAWRSAGRAWMVEIDVTYARWSELRHPAPEGATFFTGGLELLIPPNANFGLPAPDFDDIWIPAIGAEWRAHEDDEIDLYLRGGYRFRPTPAPAPTGFNNFADSDTHVLSIGVGAVLHELVTVVNGPVEVDVHGQLFLLERREVLKVEPAADGFGDLVLEGNVINVGATLTVHF